MRPTQGRTRHFWTAPSVKRSLREVERKLDDLHQDLWDLLGRLAIPSPEEIRRMKLGLDPFTPEALLIGLIWSSRQTLGRVSMRISDLLLYTPRELRSKARETILYALDRCDVIRGLECAVAEASRGSATVRLKPGTAASDENPGERTDLEANA